MATNHDLINSSDVAVTGWGGSAINVPARSISVNAAVTDAQAILGVVTGSLAVMKTGSTPAQQAAVASQLLDQIAPGLDLSTPALREFHRLKQGLDEMTQAWRALCV